MSSAALELNDIRRLVGLPTQAQGENNTTSSRHDPPKPARITTWRSQQDSDAPQTGNERQWWQRIKMGSYDEDVKSDWWFASTAVPLLVATIGPFANTLSIAALVGHWRMSLNDGHGNILPQLSGLPYKDPNWAYWSNVCSLICGSIGNLFLMLNFGRVVGYIVALPVTIICFFITTGILAGITSALHIYAPPSPTMEVYTQSYWYAVMAAALYLICSMLLMLNLLGYLLGHYPQNFNLNDDQRILIVQTILFFVWLAAGSAVFSHIERRGNNQNAQDWTYVDAIYFCDVTILTIGVGDLYPHDNLARGLVIPYSVCGIVLLGLVVSSLNTFIIESGKENIVKHKFEKERSRAIGRTAADSGEFELEPFSSTGNRRLKPEPRIQPAHSLASRRAERRTKLILMREEKDRFDAVREIQLSAVHFTRWWRLFLSTAGFAILWCIGAVIFWGAEKEEQNMSYFQSLYFSYVSLLTIGSINFAPKSNAGRAFFVVWSIVAVPTMTILVSNLSSTVFESIAMAILDLSRVDNRILPRQSIFRNFVERHPRLNLWLEMRKQKRTLQHGMALVDPDEDLEMPSETDRPTLEELASEKETYPDTTRTLVRRLALAIKGVASDLELKETRKYSYEEWVEFTRLIRFTTPSQGELVDEEEEGIIEWDWIGENSPMLSGRSEPEFVLDRLCESLIRYSKQADRLDNQGVPKVKQTKERVTKDDVLGNEDFVGNQKFQHFNAKYNDRIDEDSNVDDNDDPQRFSRIVADWTDPTSDIDNT